MRKFIAALLALTVGCGGMRVETTSAQSALIPKELLQYTDMVLELGIERYRDFWSDLLRPGRSVVAPQIVFQLRHLDGCLPNADAVAENLDRLFRLALGPDVYVAQACVTADGAREPATTIGVWLGETEGLDVSRSLQPYDLLADVHESTDDVFPVIATWISLRFMSDQATAGSVDNQDFDVFPAQTKVMLNAQENTVTTHIEGQGTGALGIHVAAEFIESLEARRSQDTNYVECEEAPSAYAVKTELSFPENLADGRLEELFAGRGGVLAGIVAAGLYPSRMLIENSELGGALHVIYSNRGEVIEDGVLAGIKVVAEFPQVDKRYPCVLISASADGVYKAHAYDLRGPYDYQWSGLNVTPLEPHMFKTTVSFPSGGFGAASYLFAKVTDLDGLFAVGVRAVSE